MVNNLLIDKEKRKKILKGGSKKEKIECEKEMEKWDREKG